MPPLPGQPVLPGAPSANAAAAAWAAAAARPAAAPGPQPLHPGQPPPPPDLAALSSLAASAKVHGQIMQPPLPPPTTFQPPLPAEPATPQPTHTFHPPLADSPVTTEPSLQPAAAPGLGGLPHGLSPTPPGLQAFHAPPPSQGEVEPASRQRHRESPSAASAPSSASPDSYASPVAPGRRGVPNLADPLGLDHSDRNASDELQLQQMASNALGRSASLDAAEHLLARDLAMLLNDDDLDLDNM